MFGPERDIYLIDDLIFNPVGYFNPIDAYLWHNHNQTCSKHVYDSSMSHNKWVIELRITSDGLLNTTNRTFVIKIFSNFRIFCFYERCIFCFECWIWIETLWHSSETKVDFKCSKLALWLAEKLPFSVGRLKLISNSSIEISIGDFFSAIFRCTSWYSPSHKHRAKIIVSGAKEQLALWCVNHTFGTLIMYTL